MEGISTPKGWTVQLARSAEKTLRRLPSERPRLERAISALPQGDVRRLQASDEYRLRVGDWRILFRLDWQRRLITVLVIAQRGQVYRR